MGRSRGARRVCLSYSRPISNLKRLILLVEKTQNPCGSQRRRDQQDPKELCYAIWPSGTFCQCTCSRRSSYHGTPYSYSLEGMKEKRQCIGKELTILTLCCYRNAKRTALKIFLSLLLNWVSLTLWFSLELKPIPTCVYVVYLVDQRLLSVWMNIHLPKIVVHYKKHLEQATPITFHRHCSCSTTLSKKASSSSWWLPCCKTCSQPLMFKR